MTELYSFDNYKGYHLPVEGANELGEYTGIAYKHAHQNPITEVTGKDGEKVRNLLFKHVDEYLEEMEE